MDMGSKILSFFRARVRFEGTRAFVSHPKMHWRRSVSNKKQNTALLSTPVCMRLPATYTICFGGLAWLSCEATAPLVATTLPIFARPTAAGKDSGELDIWMRLATHRTSPEIFWHISLPFVFGSQQTMDRFFSPFYFPEKGGEAKCLVGLAPLRSHVSSVGINAKCNEKFVCKGSRTLCSKGALC